MNQEEERQKTPEEVEKELEEFYARFECGWFSDESENMIFPPCTPVDNLNNLRVYYEKGNLDAIPKALFMCCASSLPIPGWLRKAFISAHQKLQGFQARGWDEVLGRPPTKNIHLAMNRSGHKSRRGFMRKSGGVRTKSHRKSSALKRWDAV